MSCLECSRRETTLLHEKNNLRKYAKYLSRRKDGPTPDQLAELEKIRTHVRLAKEFLDGHQAECDA